MKFKIAKYCNCTPWELGDVPLWWQYKAIEYMNAEAEGEQMLADKHKRSS